MDNASTANHKGLVIEAGFELVESAIEIQLEDNHEVPYLWIIGQK